LRLKDAENAQRLEKTLIEFSDNVQFMRGIQPDENRLALVEQLIESIRRVDYVYVIREQEHNSERANPNSELFDPLKAAVIYRNSGNIDEACWLTFLSIHFGKHKNTGWRLARDIYGALEGEEIWSWDRVIDRPGGLANWLVENYETLVADGTPRHFGNHRKYETLRPSSSKNTGAVLSSYIRWIDEYGSHSRLFEHAMHEAGGNARSAFRYLYDNMNVLRFGRTAKFDYLTMLAKLGLASIEADSPYLIGSTGPLRGAKLLFGGSTSSAIHSAQALEELVVSLGDELQVGMQEMEDSLCNWQKSPGRFIRFRG